MSQLAFVIVELQIICFAHMIYSMRDEIKKLKKEVEKKKNAIAILEQVAKDATDPAKIEAEMEAAANLREMRDARRTTMPRENDSPPAVVHRPKLRNVPKPN